MKSKQTFTQFIKQCCAAREWNLRKMLRRELPNHGFRIIEDDWVSERGGKYNSVHNMLAIRGEPTVCLAAHWKCSQITDGRFVLPIASAICRTDFLPVSARPTGAVAISMPHNWRKLLRETPLASRCSAMVGCLDMGAFLRTALPREFPGQERTDGAKDSFGIAEKQEGPISKPRRS